MTSRRRSSTRSSNESTGSPAMSVKRRLLTDAADAERRGAPLRGRMSRGGAIVRVGAAGCVVAESAASQRRRAGIQRRERRYQRRGGHPRRSVRGGAGTRTIARRGGALGQRGGGVVGDEGGTRDGSHLGTTRRVSTVAAVGGWIQCSRLCSRAARLRRRGESPG